jgi:hypothetical protein
VQTKISKHAEIFICLIYTSISLLYGNRVARGEPAPAGLQQFPATNTLARPIPAAERHNHGQQDEKSHPHAGAFSSARLSNLWLP